MEIILFSALLLFLLLVNAVLVACEVSLVKLRYATLGEDADESMPAKKWPVRFLIDNADWTAQVIRFGIMVTTVGMGLMAFPILFYFESHVILPDSLVSLIFVSLLCFVLVVSVVSFFGFLAPRGIAMMRPQGTLESLSWFVSVIVLILLPWFKILRILARKLFKMLGVEFKEDYNILDFEVQIRALADDEPNLSSQTRMILQNTLRLQELETSDVVLPRNQVQIMDLEKSVEENIELARQTGHTRFPLCREGLDDCVGLVHIKDLFRFSGQMSDVDLNSIKRDILSFTDDTLLESALNQLLAKKAHMALLRDEFGSVIGILTLESILESLIGDIHDEFDIPEEEKVSVISHEDYKIDGLTPIHEVEQRLDVEISDTEASTFGGLVTEELGRLPDAGEAVFLTEPSLSVTIQEVDEKRILSATVKKVPKHSEET
ncbi:hemolysin family protein [Rubellicoccus peritrichatus]|uniref:Hemolysin family protein n=1 Tax=Rubellicoccus peritrichatus TaxID=3080537 RepID=A0AAQ3LD00_9BACT|nr:hemolysin family protein [Puniceicoccus sp. CR14]WOO41308.1 hemolysin family protein [Puniceicoccus sp. CR14]